LNFSYLVVTSHRHHTSEVNVRIRQFYFSLVILFAVLASPAPAVGQQSLKGRSSGHPHRSGKNLHAKSAGALGPAVAIRKTRSLPWFRRNRRQKSGIGTGVIDAAGKLGVPLHRCHVHFYEGSVALAGSVWTA
jgi:hypothetical protein